MLFLIIVLMFGTSYEEQISSGWSL